MAISIRRSNARRRIAAVAAVLLAAGLLGGAGCASTGRTVYERDYQAGRYSTAYASAKARAGDPNRPGAEERAALVVGLSAHAMGEDVEAERWLRPLRGSRNAEIAGKALATLGLIASERDEHERAAALLSEAANKLEGDDAANKLEGDDAAYAAFHAGEAYASLGRIDAARLQYNAAYAAADDPKLQRRVTERLSRSAFTLQLGAFSSRHNAQQAVREFTPITVGVGLGAPRIIRAERSGGRVLYLVQVGRFNDRDDASVARQRLGGDAVIAAVQPDG